MNQLFVPNRLKAIKKTSSGIINVVTIKSSVFFLMKYSLNCFVLVLMRCEFDFVMIFFIIDIKFFAVNVYCSILIIIFSSSSFINNFHRPSSVALSYFIACLLNDGYVFKSFLSLHHLVANYVNNVDERGRNIVCVRTLPSRLLIFKS